MKTETNTEHEAIARLEEILCELGELGHEASELVASLSATLHLRGESYGAFDLGRSTNPYDTTLETIVEKLTENDQF